MSISKKGESMGDLMKKMLGGKSKFTSKLKDSFIMNRTEDFFPTEIPMLDLALSGKINGGGVSSGVTVIAGESKRFKTLYALKMAEAFHKKHEDGIILFFDSEFGSTKEYFDKFEIDPERVVWIPVTTVEGLRHEVAKRLDILYQDIDNKEKNKVFVLVDSIGNLPSKKEEEDSIEGNDKQDMTRAKQTKSFFRVTTAKTCLLNIPMVVIAHTYKTQEMFSKDIVSGGTGPMYSANTVFIITRKQDKASSGEIQGYEFVINIDKSRYIKEKSKLPIKVHYDKGILRYSGLSDLAVDLGILEKCRISRRSGFRYVDKDAGDITEVEAKKIDSDGEFWNSIFEKTKFIELVEQKFGIKNSVNETKDEEIEE